MIVLWEPMYPGDARSDIPAAMFDDPRVTSFWDPHEISGTWFGNRTIGSLTGGIIWDAYYAFTGSAHWGDAPDHVVASGSDIIGSVDALQRSFVPLLR